MSEALDRDRWILAGAMTALGLVVCIPAAIFHWGWRAAALVTFLELVLVGIHVFRTRDPLVRRLLPFAVVVGFGELPTDAFSVVLKGTLVYPPGEPLIWVSPLYMPFSWMATMVQMGFLAWWMGRRWGMGRATFTMALVGAAYVPTYETLARWADFWIYRDCPMVLGATPLYVILAEGLICAALPLLMRRAETRSLGTMALLGLAQAGVVYAATWLGFALVGHL